jgi:glutamine amidotransferase
VHLVNVDTSLQNKGSISVIDYGVINTQAVCNLLRTLDIEPEVIRKPSQANPEIRTFILPGVGNFDQGMNSLIDSGFAEYLLKEFHSGARIIAICLGFQMLGLGSPEGKQKGLGIFESECLAVTAIDQRNKNVNNGWGRLTGEGKFGHIQGQFYFTHSYGYSASELAEKNDSYSVYKLEETDIAGGIVSDRIAGFQFHPERSHLHGEKLMRRVFEFWGM